MSGMLVIDSAKGEIANEVFWHVIPKLLELYYVKVEMLVMSFG